MERNRLSIYTDYIIEKQTNGCFRLEVHVLKKFQRKDLQEKTATTEAMFKLLHAVGNNQYLQLSSDLFSRKLLKELYDQGAFKATSYNHYNPKNDYDFLLKMFNKRAKNSISTLQQKKITAILLNSIKPFFGTEVKKPDYVLKLSRKEIVNLWV